MRDSSGSQEKHTHSSSSGFVIIPDFHLPMNSEIIVTLGALQSSIN